MLRWLHQILFWLPGCERELALLDDLVERERAKRAAHLELLRSRSMRLAIVLAIAASIGAHFGTLAAWRAAGGGRSLDLSPLVIALAGGWGLVASGVLYAVFMPRYRRAVRAHLCARGIPVCMSCGYNLHALAERRCPECGFACDGARTSRGVRPGLSGGAASASQTPGDSPDVPNRDAQGQPVEARRR
ncbi:MAG: hypothetical protein AB7Q17_02155 [Phycisphaerae bacterium]